MNDHILIVDDHQDIHENLERKLLDKNSAIKVSVADNPDSAYRHLLKYKIEHPITLLILDLTFEIEEWKYELKNGTDLLNKLKRDKLKVDTIIYSSHSNMNFIYPIITNYQPKGYVIKSNTSSNELMLAVFKVSKGKHYFSTKVQEQQLQRYKYTHKIDETDEIIIKYISKVDSEKEWMQLYYDNILPIGYKSVMTRIKTMMANFNVKNQKELVLMLYKIGLI